MDARRTVFISYAREDAHWRDQLVAQLSVLQGALRLWHDGLLPTGENWNANVRHELDKASVAVLLVTDKFVSSPYVLQNEVPRILERHGSGKLAVVPVVISRCSLEKVTGLGTLQTYPSGRCISDGNELEQNIDFATVALNILQKVTEDAERAAEAAEHRFLKARKRLHTTAMVGAALLVVSFSATLYALWQRNRFQTETSTVVASLSKANSDLNKTNADLGTVNSDLLAAKDELRDLRERSQKLEKENAEASKASKASKESMDKLGDELKRTKDKLEDVSNVARECDTRANAAISLLYSAEAKLSTCQSNWRLCEKNRKESVVK